MDKPGRRKKKSLLPWKKIGAVAVGTLIVVGIGWEVYWNFIYTPPPIYAQFNTTDGSFEVELFPACAPKTVANFVSLANQGYYNDLVWHRIVKGFVIQTGDNNTKGGLNSTRSTWGYGGTPATVPLELCGLHNYQGYLATAHTSRTTNSGSQFYINLSNSSSNISLDGNYTIFGKVISGWSVVQALGNSPTCQPPSCPTTWPSNEPLPAVFLNSVVIQGTTYEASSTT